MRSCIVSQRWHPHKLNSTRCTNTFFEIWNPCVSLEFLGGMELGNSICSLGQDGYVSAAPAHFPSLEFNCRLRTRGFSNNHPKYCDVKLTASEKSPQPIHQSGRSANQYVIETLRKYHTSATPMKMGRAIPILMAITLWFGGPWEE